jgi:ribosomal protein S1
VSDVTAVVAPGQEVVAWVLSKEDGDTKRLSLTLKDPAARQERGQASEEGEAGGNASRGSNVAAKVARSARSGGESRPAAKQLTVGKKGDWVQGTVKTVLAFGALVEVEEGVDGLLHVSEMSGASRLSLCCKGWPCVALVPSHASPALDTCTDTPAPADNPDAKPESIVKEGDSVRVRIDKIERDAKTGGEKIRLSMMEKFDVRP